MKKRTDNPRNSKPISMYPLKPEEALRLAMSVPTPKVKLKPETKPH
jgi:hypothetical protein